jgi:hypothetical protein
MTPLKINEVKDGVILEVNVKPQSKKFKIIIEDDEIVVCCRETPVKGKVNKELVKEFSKLFHSEVKLVSGFTSKQKKLLIWHLGKNDVEQILINM